MLVRFDYAMVRLLLLCFSVMPIFGCQRTELPQNLNGKYQFLEQGSNVTGTHTHVVGYYLKIDTRVEPNAIYFVTDNGDIIGGHKDRFLLRTKGSKVDLIYAGCVSQSYVGDQEAPCTSESKIGEKRYTFERTATKLKMIWAVNGSDNVILEKVKSFDFEKKRRK